MKPLLKRQPKEEQAEKKVAPRSLLGMLRQRQPEVVVEPAPPTHVVVERPEPPAVTIEVEPAPARQDQRPSARTEEPELPELKGPDWNGLSRTDPDYAYLLWETINRLEEDIDPHGPVAGMLDMMLRQIREAQRAANRRTPPRRAPAQQPERHRDNRPPVQPPAPQPRPVQAAPAPAPRPPVRESELPGRVSHQYTEEERQLLREQPSLGPGDLGLPMWDCGRCGQSLGDKDRECPNCQADLTKEQTPIEVVIELGPSEAEEPLGAEAAAAFRDAGYTVREDNPRRAGKGKRRKGEKDEHPDGSQDSAEDIPEFLKRASR